VVESEEITGMTLHLTREEAQLLFDFGARVAGLATTRHRDVYDGIRNALKAAFGYENSKWTVSDRRPEAGVGS